MVQLPLVIYLVSPFTFLGERLTDSVIGVGMDQIFVTTPFLVIAARPAFAAVDPALDRSRGGARTPILGAVLVGRFTDYVTGTYELGCC